MLNNIFFSVKKTIHSIQLGNGVILKDNQNIESGAILIIAGQLVNKKNVSLLLNNTRNIILLSMFQEHSKKLNINGVSFEDIGNDTMPFNANLKVKRPIDKHKFSLCNIITTIITVSNPNVTKYNIRKYNNIFPFISKDNGILDHFGYIEGSVDTIRLSNLYPVSVLCELINKDGSMQNYREIFSFSKKYKLVTLDINNLFLYRVSLDNIIFRSIKTSIPILSYGFFSFSVFFNIFSQESIEVIANNCSIKNPIIRIHSSCFTGDLFHSLKCDCNSQLKHVQLIISLYGGIIIYLEQEGRNIGLINKLRAYKGQKKYKFNTLKANEILGLPIDNRHYYSAVNLLLLTGYRNCRLIANNPMKYNILSKFSIFVIVLVSNSIVTNWNILYLKTKKYKLKHKIKGI